jgi:hypothetical protein
MNIVIARCDGLRKLEAGLPPDLRACAPRMWAAAEGVLAALAGPEGGEMAGLRFKVRASRRTLTARRGQLVLAGLPGFAPTAHFTLEFNFADDGRAVLLFVPRALGVPRRRALLTRLRPCGGNGEAARAECQTCEAREGLRACPHCEAVWYCSRECCAADWHVHGGVCDAMRAAAR